MSVSRFEVDEEVYNAISILRPVFGVRTNAQVIRKALALAKVAAEHADSENRLTIIDSRGEKKVILLNK